MVTQLSGVGVFACDICGCTSGSNYTGAYPGLHKNYAGIRYSEVSFISEHPSDGALGKDEMHRIESWSRVYINPNIQITLVVPYLYNQRIEVDKYFHSQGLGDLSLLANFVLLGSSDLTGQSFKQFSSVGFGCKLPTGNDRMIQNKSTLPKSMQLGSGSVDYILSFQHLLSYKMTGVSIESSYKYNTSSQQVYQIGNTFLIGSKLFTQIQSKIGRMVPALGVFYEHRPSDLEKGLQVDYTGSKVSLFHAEWSFFMPRISFHVIGQRPIYQSISQGYTTRGMSGMFQINYLF